ncbi:hypothetical protein D9M68_954980 [compost metagenome]
MVQVDHPLVAGQGLVQRDEAVALPESPHGAVVDGDLALREAIPDRLHLLEVAGVEVAVLELAYGFERLQPRQALLQAHGCSRGTRLAWPQ